MYAIQNLKTEKFVYSTDYRYLPPHQLTSKTKMITYSSIEEASHDFCGQAEVRQRLQNRCAEIDRSFIHIKYTANTVFNYLTDLEVER